MYGPRSFVQSNRGCYLKMISVEKRLKVFSKQVINLVKCKQAYRTKSTDISTAESHAHCIRMFLYSDAKQNLESCIEFGCLNSQVYNP